MTKTGNHPTLQVPLEIIQDVDHVDNCCSGDKSRRYTWIMKNRLEWNRPIPLCLGAPAPFCPAGCGFCGYTDYVSVMYFDDRAFSDSLCCNFTFAPQKRSCSKTICNKITGGICCSIDQIDMASSPKCCPCCKCFRVPFLDQIADPKQVADALNTAIKDYKSTTLSAVVPTGAPEDLEMER